MSLTIPRIKSVADFNERFFIRMRRCLQLNDQANSLNWKAGQEDIKADEKFIINATAKMFEKWSVDEFNRGLDDLEAHLNDLQEEQSEKASPESVTNPEPSS